MTAGPLLAIREQSGLSVSKFCAAVGISPHSWYRVCRDPLGKAGWSPTVDRIEEYTKTLREDLFPGAVQRIEYARMEDLVEDAGALAPPLEETPHDHLEAMDRAVQVKKALNTLTPREEKVLRMRFGLGEPECSLKEAGKEFGVQSERVRQIEAKALRKLRHPSRARRLKAYAETAPVHMRQVRERLTPWSLLNSDRAALYDLAVEGEEVKNWKLWDGTVGGALPPITIAGEGGPWDVVYSVAFRMSEDVPYGLWDRGYEWFTEVTHLVGLFSPTERPYGGHLNQILDIMNPDGRWFLEKKKFGWAASSHLWMKCPGCQRDLAQLKGLYAGRRPKRWWCRKCARRR